MIDETKIEGGIAEFAKFKALAHEAVERCKAAQEKADYHRGQNEVLKAQHDADEARHRVDLLRIAELEAFIGHITELYNGAAQKLKLGGFRRPNSPAEPDFAQMEREIAEAVRAGNNRTVVRTEPLPPLVASKG